MQSKKTFSDFDMVDMKSNKETKFVYVVGNLVEAAINGDVHAIAHQANCFRTMGAGVARAIAISFRGAMLADYCDPRTKEQRLGGFTVASGKGCFVYNLYGQFYPGPNTDYDALASALSEMKQDVIKRGISKIGFPLIGCGIGGGDWNRVRGMIKDTFDGVADIYIYVLSESELEKYSK